MIRSFSLRGRISRICAIRRQLPLVVVNKRTPWPLAAPLACRPVPTRFADKTIVYAMASDGYPSGCLRVSHSHQAFCQRRGLPSTLLPFYQGLTVLGPCRAVLESRSSLPKCLRYLVLGEPPSFALQQAHYLLMRLPNLIAHWHKTPGEMVIVLPQKSASDCKITDVLKNQRPFSLILILSFKETRRMISPVAATAQVVGGMIPIIEAVAITLLRALA